MSSKTVESRSWFEQLLQHEAPVTNEPAVVDEERLAARAAVQELPLPGRRQELWRYSSVSEIFEQSFEPATEDLDVELMAESGDWLLPDTQAYRLLFVNGRFAPALSNVQELPEGVRLGSLRTALHADAQSLAIWFGQAAKHDTHIFTALNTALMHDGLFIHLAAETKLDRPIEVMHLNLAPEKPLLIQPRNLVVLERGAQAELTERYRSSGDSHYFHNGVSEIVLEEGAELEHYRLQMESNKAYHLHQGFLAQGANSRYRNTTLALGGKWSRYDLQVRFKAEGADCETNGLYLVGEHQLTDQHLDVLHDTPHNSGRHNYKGIAYSSGKAVFDGRILVAKDAQKTDAHLSNKNLLLSRRAEVDTKPQLEIYADDVQCSHGTTVGQLDPQQRFYLQSRGLDADTARKMLCIGFASEVLESIKREAIRDYTLSRMQGALDNVIEKLNEQ
ncbi:MAG: Fe-S cluster assembly protein SufD [Gammaproteobacteria bacterium]|nr:Fe-S cluster assembly protein SufD [Gammaproteobacteria bacterium]